MPQVRLAILWFVLLLTNCLCTQNKKYLTIDCFDKANYRSSKINQWGTYSDSSHGGGTHTILSYFKDKKVKSQVLHFSYTLLKKDWEYKPYAGISCSINSTTLPETFIYGIAYEFKGNKHTFNYLSSSVTDNCNFKKQIPESKEWTTVIIPFSELKQDSWGLQIPFNYFDLTGFTWLFSGNDHDTGSVFIENIRFLRSEKNSSNNFSGDSSIRFSKPDSIASLIFNATNDSLFNRLSEYKNKSENYYNALRKIKASETLIDSLLQKIKASTLSSEDKECLCTLLKLSINNYRGDVLIKATESNFRWKKKYNKFISFDSLRLIDKECQKKISTLQAMKVWASDEWDYASLYKAPKTKDSSYLKEIRALQFKPNDVIAEIGAGPGYFEQNLSKFCNNLTVYVTEIDSASISKLDTKLQLLDLYDDKNIQYITVLGDEKNSQLSPALFDKIIIKNTFHHFTYPNEMLQDIKGILKKNGSIYIIDILMDEVEKPECSLYLKRAEFLKYFIDNGYTLIKETPLSYHNKCFEFQLLP